MYRNKVIRIFQGVNLLLVSTVYKGPHGLAGNRLKKKLRPMKPCFLCVVTADTIGFLFVCRLCHGRGFHAVCSNDKI